ncbi:hypothetical protein O9929_18645 [Vibrio lentus]|nr:hypothetical protein [Vibrio lentus]
MRTTNTLATGDITNMASAAFDAHDLDDSGKRYTCAGRGNGFYRENGRCTIV